MVIFHWHLSFRGGFPMRERNINPQPFALRGSRLGWGIDQKIHPSWDRGFFFLNGKKLGPLSEGTLRIPKNCFLETLSSMAIGNSDGLVRFFCWYFIILPRFFPISRVSIGEQTKKAMCQLSVPPIQLPWFVSFQWTNNPSPMQNCNFLGYSSPLETMGFFSWILSNPYTPEKYPNMTPYLRAGRYNWFQGPKRFWGYEFSANFFRVYNKPTTVPNKLAWKFLDQNLLIQIRGICNQMTQVEVEIKKIGGEFLSPQKTGEMMKQFDFPIFQMGWFNHIALRWFQTPRPTWCFFYELQAPTDQPRLDLEVWMIAIVRLKV